MRSREYVDTLSSVTFEDVFNPYLNRCSVYDLEDAPNRRRSTLLALLNAAESMDIDSMWIGRDLGYRGGRRTGLALTDDVHLAALAARWCTSIERATAGPPVAERTAAVIWSMLEKISAPVFLWNVFPFHPHNSEDSFSNRTHSSHERRVGEDLLANLISLLQPRRLVAIGNDAARSASQFAGTCEVVHVRHPSYGGQSRFVRQITSIYDLVNQPEDPRFL